MSEEKRSARVYVLHGERRDLHPGITRAETVLQRAIANGLSEVVLVGVDRRGQIYVAGSYRDMDKASGMLMHGANVIFNSNGLLPGEVLELDGE